MRRFLWLLPLLVAMAPVADPGLTKLQADDARVAQIAWRLQVAAVGLCAEVTRLPGFSVHALGQYAPDERARVAAGYKIGVLPAVLAVVPGSAADKAGLRAGDAIVAIDGAATAATLSAKADYGAVADVEDRIDARLKAGAVTLSIIRDGLPRTATLTGDTGCASRVQIVPGDALGAQADGRYVQLTGASVAFASSDAALAALTGHELAHNFLRHRAFLEGSGASYGLLAGFGKSGRKWRQTESEADRLSVWLVARAGFPVDEIVPFWTAWAKRRDPGPFGAGTHPAWKDRIARMAEAVAQVKAQQAAGAPLVPPQ